MRRCCGDCTECPIEVKLILPANCRLDENAVKERIQQVGPSLFIDLCGACPLLERRDTR